MNVWAILIIVCEKPIKAAGSKRQQFFQTVRRSEEDAAAFDEVSRCKGPK